MQSYSERHIKDTIGPTANLTDCNNPTQLARDLTRILLDLSKSCAPSKSLNNFDGGISNSILLESITNPK